MVRPPSVSLHWLAGEPRSQPTGSRYDELHPSEKTGGVIAKHFIDVVAGNSSYGTSYGWAAN